MKLGVSNTYVTPSFAEGSSGSRWVQAQQKAQAAVVAQYGGLHSSVMSTESLQATYTRGSFQDSSMRVAERSLVTIQAELKKLDVELKAVQPDIVPQGWDVTVVKGRLSVMGGGLSPKDKEWLETKLNHNEKMVSAAQAYVEAAVVYLQTSEENPPVLMMNSLGGGGRPVEYNFPDVAKQLAGVLGFRENIRQVVDHHNFGRAAHEKQTSVEGYGTGHYSFDFLAGRMAFNSKVE